jgi:serine/threonine-protein kinase HipA
MKRGRAEAIYDEVRSAVLRWPEFAGEAKVPERWVEEVGKGHRAQLARVR